MLEKWKRDWRIVWAIAVKDITDAIQNKTILGVMGSALFVVLMYKFLPVLSHSGELPTVLIYDAGQSDIVAELESGAMLDVYLYPSQEVMEQRLAAGDVPELGLVVPADFDQRLAAGETPELAGYVLYWVSEADARELETMVEQEIAVLSGVPVDIRIAGQVYARVDSFGAGLMVALSQTIVLSMVGVSVVAHLMLEEKQTKTMDALVISPASAAHVVMGKAIAGLFYCAAAATCIFALNVPLVLHWGLAVLGVAVGALFTVSLGLLMGTFFEDRQQLTLWGFLAFQVLLLPPFLSIMEDLLPKVVIQVMGWIPTVALSRVFVATVSYDFSWGLLASNLGLVLGSALLVYGVLTWQVRRQTR